MKIPEKHRAVAKAWVDGAEIEGRSIGGTWASVVAPAWREDLEYRIKITKPSINWEHVSHEYVALATDSDGNSFIYTRIPETTPTTWTADCSCKSAEAFQSFVKGTCDWKDSLVLRPSADSEEQEPRHE